MAKAVAVEVMKVAAKAVAVVVKKNHVQMVHVAAKSRFFFRDILYTSI